MQEDKEETEEINKRKTNVIIHGLKEPSVSAAEDRMAEDEDHADTRHATPNTVRQCLG